MAVSVPRVVRATEKARRWAGALAEQPLHRGVLQPFQSLRESRRADVENQELRVTGRLGQVHLTRQERPRGGRRPRHRVRWLQLGGSAGRAPRGSVLAAD